MNGIFPSWRYHKKEGAKLVMSAEELEALGKGWCESPADFGVITAPSADQMDSKQEKVPEQEPKAPEAPAEPAKVPEQELTEDQVIEKLIADGKNNGLSKSKLKKMKKADLLQMLGA